MGKEIIEKDIFKKIKAGDEIAFKKLFKAYYTRLYVFAFKYVKDKDTAEEIVHDILVGLWEKRRHLEITTSISAYLYTSTKNRSLNYISKYQNHTEFNDDISRNMSYSMQQQQELTDGEIKSALIAAVAKLPKRCGEIFTLCKFEGLSYKEIAEYFNIANKTVEAQMGIALRNLRKTLRPVYQKLLQ